MFKDKFNIIYLALFILIVIIRKAYIRKYGVGKIKLSRKNLFEIMILSFVGLGMVAPLVFIFTTWLKFANYNLPEFIRWIGTVIFISACWLLWRSHGDLGKYWTFSLEIKNNHILVKDGVYRYIRHPMYAAHFLWAVGQLLIISNWIAGPFFLLFFIPLYFYRVPKEEAMMIRKFGKEYKKYMEKTGRIFLKLR
jgi:protein-S-isoprenylcysteine O-methyltransferase Ste14